MLSSSLIGGLLVTAALVTLAPDTPGAGSPERGYQQAVAKLRRGAFDQSLRDAQLAKARMRWRGHRDGGWGCKFRLLEAEILLEKAETARAREMLVADADGCRSDARLEVHRRVLLARLRRSPDPTGALALLDEARRIAEASGSAGARAEVDLVKGQVLAPRSLDRAEDAFRSAQRFASAGHDVYQSAAAANNLGLVQQLRSRCDSAIPNFNQALQVWHELGADQLSAATANNLGLCYSELGDFDKALEYRREAMRLVKPSPRLAQVLGETGRLYLVRSQPGDAIPYFRRALEAARNFNTPAEAARWASNLATAFRDLGDWNSAEAANQEALRLNPDPISARKLELNRAAIAAGRGRLQEARDIYQKIIASNPDNPVILWQGHAGLAQVWLSLGDWPRAAQSLENGIDVVESSRSELKGADHKITFLSRLIRFYQDYVDALMDRGLTLHALEVADSSRARVLAEGLYPEGVPRGGIRGERALKDLARGSRGVWLSYWIAPRRSFLWVVTPREIRSFVLPPEAQITKAVEEHRSLIEHSVRDPMQAQTDAGQWLFRELIGVARAGGLIGDRVVIVPDGPLHLLNFETLPVADGSPRYWIEDVLVTVAPSLEICARPAVGRKNAAKSVLIIANANGAGSDYPPLPNAATEISRLRERFPGPSTRVVEGKEADPAAYFAAHPERYSMIHVAAHGEANRRSPLDSALILSPGEKGFKLYARDIMNAPLDADLVTISACRSSGARAYAGEGLVGVARAFLQAGARAVIAGLWDVSDHSTSLLMDQMYERIAAGTPPAESLRTAKISMLRSRYSKPYHWGPFQLYTR
jgi:CHAT domain-containing protein/tetratricopeptide (TPR) repeat protein